MSIQSITESELLTEGIRALPTRPSAPTLYGGAPLSAEELKAAFDRLPSLIARRLNALLDATGLFEAGNRYETLAELIATRITPTHSLAQFFRDVTDGSLALYLSADGEHTLADVLSELRRELLALSRYEMCVEGEGDLFSDVRVDGDLVTFVKEARVCDIVDAAKPYVDAPRGSVEVGCPLPVSGERVASALAEVRAACDPAPLDARVRVLEESARGILYHYPTVDTETARFTADRQALPTAALLRMGGARTRFWNILPEPLLSFHHGSSLTVRWDKGAGCLILDGEMTAGEDVCLASFYAPPDIQYYALGVVAHGGTLTGTPPTLRLEQSNGRACALSMPTEGMKTKHHNFGSNMLPITKLCVKASANVTFSAYRWNIFFSPDDGSEIRYTPFTGRLLPTALPAALSVLGPNEWTDESEKEGGGSVVFTAPEGRFRDDVFISFYADSEHPTATTLRLSVLMGDGETESFSLPLRERAEASLYAPAGCLSFTLTVGEEGDDAYTLTVRDFQVEHVSATDPEASPYSLPMSDAFVFPDSLSRFAEELYGMEGETGNYFDFERGGFVRQVAHLTVDGSLSFTADATLPHRYFAPMTLPAGVPEAAYRPIAVFAPRTEEGETADRLWFDEAGVYIESEVFSSAKALTDFLTLLPIDVLYSYPARLSLFTEEERAALETPLLSVVPCAHMRFLTADGTPTPAYARMQYQVKLASEVSA